MSLAQVLSEAVAFQLKFYNREDSELKSRREHLWAEVDTQINRLIDERVTKELLKLKRK